MAGNRGLIAAGVDAPAGRVELVPVHYDRRKNAEQALGYCVLLFARVGLGLEASKHRAAAAQHVHRVRFAREHLEHLLDRIRHAALRDYALAESAQLSAAGQMTI